MGTRDEITMAWEKFDWKEFDRLLVEYDERFKEVLPTEQMPPQDFRNAIEIMREALRTGKPYEPPPLPEGCIS